MSVVNLILLQGITGLAKFTEDAYKYFFRWMNDPEVSRFLGDREPAPYSIEDARNHVKVLEKDSLLIVVKQNLIWVPVGYIRLVLRPRHKIANFVIAIGEQEFRGQGHGKVATVLTIKYAIENLDLFSVHLVVSVNNIAAVKTYEKVGFRACGLRHGARLEDGRRIDEIVMEYTRDMYYNRRQDYEKIKSIS